MKKAIRLLVVFIAAFGLIFPNLLASAETYNAYKTWSSSKLKRYAEDNILYYDDQFEIEEGGHDECISNGGIDVTIDDSDNIGYIMSILKQAGYSVTSIAAIMGNLQAENSTHNPRLLEKPLNGSHIVPDGFVAYDLSKSGQSGKTYDGGFGIAQWTYWSRVKSLQEFANSISEPVYSIIAQAKFLAQEIQGYDGLSPSILNTMSMLDATKRVLNVYENPLVQSEQVLQTRYNNAKGYYNRLINQNPDDKTVEPNEELVICPEGGGEGDPISMSDDDIQKYIYLQGDPRWGNLNYGPDGINGSNGTSIRESGCGPSSFATIISILKNQYIYPSETADIAGRGGQHCYNEGKWCGSNHSITTYLANHYGVNSRAINISIDSIQAALDSGQMVHIVGSGSLPFSKGGHYVAIIKSSGDKWWVANSGYSAHKWEAYDPITIVSNARYAVAVWN